MSIFTRIKDAIFGRKAAASPTPSAPKPQAAPRSQPQPPPAASASSASASQPAAQVDVEEVLTALAAKNAQKLNWRTSIVDLMKLLEIDSGLQNRKELAQELGYQGDTADSAAMNIWLHKRVMQELAANGGKVPAELRD